MPRFEAIVLAAIIGTLSGCSSDPQLSNAVSEFRAIQTEVGIAPDAVRPDPAYEAFLGRVQNNCGQVPIGSYRIVALLDTASFIDLTSRFYNGIISQQNYVDSLSGGYFTSSDSPGIRCILQQMPARGTQPPSALPPVIN
jgi:hypothetical protein